MSNLTKPLTAPSSISRPLRIALWGNFGTLNFGNECTLAAAIHNLRLRLPHAELICICSNPADTVLRHGIKAIAIRGQGELEQRAKLPRALRGLLHIAAQASGWWRAFQITRTLDALIITGTGILTDHGEGVLGFPYELFKWSLLTKACRGKLLFASVGVESITRPLAQKFFRQALRLADFRCYRDQHSRQLLQRYGFAAAADPLYPDLAFSLPATLASQAAGATTARRVVAVGLYNYRHRGEAGGEDLIAYNGYLEWLCRFILWLFEHDYAVRVVIGDGAYDAAIRSDLRARLEANGKPLAELPFYDECARSFEEVVNQLASADIVVATRYHNVLLALLLGRPVVSVSYEGKNEALMSGMGLTAYCQSLDQFRFDMLIEQFVDLEKNAAALRATINETARQYRVQLDAEYDAMVRIVRGVTTAR